MNLIQLIDRNLQQRRLSSILTVLSVGLGVMLVTAVLIVRHELDQTYKKQGAGYSLVVGPTGPALQLVLNSIYHVDKSPGLLPYSVYEEFQPGGTYRVKLAVPYAVGDSYRGFRVVATTDAIFSKVFPFPRAENSADKFQAGGPFEFDPAELKEAIDHLIEHAGESHHHHHGHDHKRQAVIGAEVARKLGIGVGHLIKPTHGIEGGHDHAHDHTWEVTGVFKHTNTPIDRVVFINLDSFYRIDEHAGAVIPSATGGYEVGLSSILVFPGPRVQKALLLPRLTKRGDFQVAEVATEVTRLLQIVGQVDIIFFWISILVVIIGVLSIMVAIYNTMNERRRELAILRAIGGSRGFLLTSIVGESVALAFSGAVIGLLFAHLLIAGVSNYVVAETGLALSPWTVLPEEFIVVGLVALTGAIAGLIPAWKAYRTDVARNLAPLS